MSKTNNDSKNRVSDNFKNRIKDLIDEYGVTILEFSKIAGVNKEVIFRATNYSIIPSVRSLLKMANNLNLSLPYLLGTTTENDLIMSANPSTFHNRLNELSENNGIKFSKIANALGISRNLFYDWIRENTYPSLDYLIDIAEFFKVSIDYLLGRTDFKN